MCGICGELNFFKENVNPHNIKMMADSLAHRGPDGEGFYTKGIIGLGHRRLSIIDLSQRGKQPMWSNDKSQCIIYNGEVYNFQEIKKELIERGYYFFSNTDTEVVVNAIHLWGIEKALSKFNGMFAFALWNKQTETLYLCRDRAGVKPLYYFLGNNTFLFASEIKSLLAHPGFIKEINPTALSQYFINGYFLNNQTIFKNTFRLSPGHFLEANGKGISKIVKYWGLEKIERNTFKGGFEDASEELENIFESAFQYRLVSEVPVGVFLSGGIDSSFVSTILKKKLNADLLHITIGFPEKSFDESPKAKRVALELGVKNKVHYLTPNEMEDALLKFCDIYDEPFSDTSGIPTYVLTKISRDYIKVALSADGGDEQFYGYESYNFYARYFKLLKFFPLQVRLFFSKGLEGIVPLMKLFSLIENWKNEASFNSQSIAKFEKMCRMLRVSDLGDLIRLMNEKGWSQDSVHKIFPFRTGELFKGTVLEKDFIMGNKNGIEDSMMRSDFLSFLRDDVLVKVDRASMFSSLECRDPFLDHRITELSFKLPLNFLFLKGTHKRILKHILKKWLSPSILEMPKRGFMIPLTYLLKGPWKPIVMNFLSREQVKKVGLLNFKEVEKELNEFYKYKGLRSEKIWMMLNFQMWAERWLYK